MFEMERFLMQGFSHQDMMALSVLMLVPVLAAIGHLRIHKMRVAIRSRRQS
jgi:hypothetical protein